MVVLREFLYRRDDLVGQFLAQLEGGVYDEEQITEQNQSGSGVGGGLAAGPLTASAERRSQGNREASRTMRQTHESRFNRLLTRLEGQEAVQFLAALDDAIWDELRRNEVLEIEAVLTLAPGVTDLSNLSALRSAAPILELMRSLPASMLPADFDPGEADKIGGQLPLIQRFADQFARAAVPCTLTPVGSARYSFFAELPREHLLAEPTNLEGEVTALVKVQRFVQKGKPETMGTGLMPGVTANRQQRREQETEQPLTVRLRHPAAVVTAIGIYR